MKKVSTIINIIRVLAAIIILASVLYFPRISEILAFVGLLVGITGYIIITVLWKKLLKHK